MCYNVIMLKLGEFQQLKIVKLVDFGAYLAEKGATDADEEVLIPTNSLPEGSEKGMLLDVFLYKDSDDRLIATTQTPLITLGGIARLKVLEITKIGAFLDWGLAKDLLLPFAEQTYTPSKGDVIPVALYIDKSDRLCATMNLHPYLSTDSPYAKDDRVTGTVYQFNERFGAFVAVDDLYHGLVPVRELIRELRPGDTVSARVAAVRDDGRLNLSLREVAHVQMDKDAAYLMSLLEQNGGTLDLCDRSSPDVIRERTGMSKAQFKRAVGRLLKNREITITDSDISLL